MLKEDVEHDSWALVSAKDFTPIDFIKTAEITLMCLPGDLLYSCCEDFGEEGWCTLPICVCTFTWVVLNLNKDGTWTQIMSTICKVLENR